MSWITSFLKIKRNPPDYLEQEGSISFYNYAKKKPVFVSQVWS